MSDAPAFAAPLRAVDELSVTEQPDQLVISVRKAVVATDPYLPGHFPGRPIYPGVFALETVRQAVMVALGERAGVLADLSAVRSLRLLIPLVPGDELRIEATIRPCDGPDTVLVDARCRSTDGADAARLTLEFRYGPGIDA